MRFALCLSVWRLQWTKDIDTFIATGGINRAGTRISLLPFILCRILQMTNQCKVSTALCSGKVASYRMHDPNWTPSRGLSGSEWLCLSHILLSSRHQGLFCRYLINLHGVMLILESRFDYKRSVMSASKQH
jgi:hypothetical protein